MRSSGASRPQACSAIFRKHRWIRVLPSTDLIEPSQTVRHEALQSVDAAAGAAYRIEYGLRANTTAPLFWIEETGRCTVDADGKPLRATA